ncbi:hypothetical protein FACS189472_05590 [Alphaproteobacteria bacterium]|nr:hypothetical protein FACS189472_05590 [Alphaproteobacteria bacterium]
MKKFYEFCALCTICMFVAFGNAEADGPLLNEQGLVDYNYSNPSAPHGFVYNQDDTLRPATSPEEGRAAADEEIEAIAAEGAGDLNSPEPPQTPVF